MFHILSSLGQEGNSYDLSVHIADPWHLSLCLDDMQDLPPFCPTVSFCMRSTPTLLLRPPAQEKTHPQPTPVGGGVVLSVAFLLSEAGNRADLC